MTKLLLIYSILFLCIVACAEESSLESLCIKTLTPFPGTSDEKALASACAKVQKLDGCESVEKVPLYHYEKHGHHPSKQKILVFSLIHGDETPAGSVVRYWLERLEGIDPRNSWRIIPVLNPDGVKMLTRTNANKIDLNRNFPSKDWEAKAIEYWKRDTKENPRRFPGHSSASEPEVKCALKHIEEFKPDMIVSIHTPLKVLDFDGPKIPPPKFDFLPWRSLGTYPGSLGRMMWVERKVPVLTMEMKDVVPPTTKPLADLQDVIGYLVSLEFGQKKTSKK